MKPGQDNCGRIAVAAEPVEQLIADAVLYRITSPAVLKAMHRRPKKAGPDHAAVIAACEQKLEELAVMFASDQLGRREWLTARHTIEERRDHAHRSLAREEGTEALAVLRDVDARVAWEHLDLDRRRAIVAALIDKIVISSANGRNSFAGDRVDIVWKA